MGEEYGVEMPRVREIIAYETGHLVPSMPPSVRGVMNLRGNVVPVVDLARCVRAASHPGRPGDLRRGPRPALERRGGPAGADDHPLGRVIDMPDEAIKPVPDFGTRIQAEYLRGLGGDRGAFRAAARGRSAAVPGRSCCGSRRAGDPRCRAAHAAVDRSEVGGNLLAGDGPSTPRPRRASRVPDISDAEFALFQSLIRREAGIHLAPIKKPMLVGRLFRRLNALG